MSRLRFRFDLLARFIHTQPLKLNSVYFSKHCIRVGFFPFWIDLFILPNLAAEHINIPWIDGLLTLPLTVLEFYNAVYATRLSPALPGILKPLFMHCLQKLFCGHDKTCQFMVPTRDTRSKVFLAALIYNITVVISSSVSSYPPLDLFITQFSFAKRQINFPRIPHHTITSAIQLFSSLLKCFHNPSLLYLCFYTLW